MHFLFPVEFSIIVSIFNFLQQDDFEKHKSASKPCKNLTNHQCVMLNHIHDAKDAKNSIYILFWLIVALKKSSLLEKAHISAPLEAYSNELYIKKLQLDISGALELCVYEECRIG